MILQTVVTNDVINPAVYDPLVQFITKLTGHEFNDLSIWAILLRLLLTFGVLANVGVSLTFKSFTALSMKSAGIFVSVL